MTIDQLIRKQEKLDIIGLVRTAITNTKEDLLETQRIQMLEGINSEGRKIGKYRNKKYAIKKYDMNPVPGLGVPDLKLTGEWQGELDVEIGTDTVTFKAPDNEKSARLVNNFGYQILGLYKPNAVLYSNTYLKPEFLKLVKDALR